MCGIIGYVGQKNKAIPVILSGLKNLEYRGYDSAGICYLLDNTLNNIKAVGPIKALCDKVNINIKSNLGIGHTRWATHGAPCEANSHPHTSGKITLVHNGIIENYAQIKAKLIKEDKAFKSETDSEVAAALLDTLYEESGSMYKAILEFKKIVRGSYAMAIIVDGKFDEIYVVKNMSPLIIGLGDAENYVASDIPAILDNTRKYVLLEDGDFAVAKSDDIKLYDKNGKKKNLVVREYNGDASSIQKGHYEHFMLKEINEETIVTKRLLSKYMNNDNTTFLPDLTKYKRIIIVGCGSAMHAGLMGKYLIEKNLNIPVIVEIASEFRYKKLFLNKEDAVIAISQSGETADTIAAIKISKEQKIHTIGIVNVEESTIAREVDEVINTLAGSEIAVATTKAYIAQLIVLWLLSLRNKKINDEALLKIPNLIKELIDNPLYQTIADDIKAKNDMFFIGRLIDYAICMEGSLKLKEISYIHSEAYAAGELKHGTISLVNNDTPIFAIITDESIAEKTISNIKEVKARGAKIILIISSDIEITEDIYDYKIIIPNCYEDVSSILAIIPLQLIAYFVAKKCGCSIDKPKNLAKSVTVE